MDGLTRLMLRMTQSPSLTRIARPVARALSPRWLGLLPADLINRTYFSGFCCIDALPGRRFLMHRDPTSTELADRGIDSFGGEGLRCFSALLPVTATFLDIGANTGVYSLMACAAGTRTVHAFEPVPQIFDRLRANLAANRFTGARAHQIALTDCTGTITLYVPSGEMPTEASTREGFRPGSSPHEVRAQTVDEFVTENALETVDLMKVDTESTEPSVLQGSIDTITRSRPIILCEVLRGLTEERLHALLDPHDYRYFWLTGSGPVQVERIEGDATYRFLNFLFVPSEKVARALDLIRASSDERPSRGFGAGVSP